MGPKNWAKEESIISAERATPATRGGAGRSHAYPGSTGPGEGSGSSSSTRSLSEYDIPWFSRFSRLSTWVSMIIFHVLHDDENVEEEDALEEDYAL